MRKLNVAVVGLGRLGMVHAYNVAWQIPNARLSAVCTHNQPGIDYARDQLGNPRLYDDYQQLLADPDIDAVVIVTSSDKHCAQAAAALDAGKHVFTEKPLGVDVESCRQVAAAVARHPDRTFMIGFMRRYDVSYAYAMDKIRSGAIGKPYLVKATALDPDAQAAEFIKYTKHSAGIFLDLGIHDLDLMRWYLGSEISEVYAAGATFKHPEFHQLGDDETAVATMRFANGALGQMHIGRTAPHGYHVETEIVGTEGTIRVSAIPAKNRAELFTAAGELTECVEGFQQRFADSYLAEVREFVDCALTGRQPEVTVQDGLRSVEAALACKQAWQTGKPVQL